MYTNWPALIIIIIIIKRNNDNIENSNGEGYHSAS
jgi:hypothetical protein